MTNKCLISLLPVAEGSRHPHYNDKAYRELFGRLRVDSNLPFTKAQIIQESGKYVEGMSISGVQQKLSLKIIDNKLKPVATGGEYILKPSPLEFPHAAENEHAAMLTSNLLDIDTALCGLVRFSDGELAYVTRRFDRQPDGRKKRHQEDMAQGFNIPNLNKYDKSYEEAGKKILELSGGKRAVVFEFYKRVVHAYLTGNDDFHLKNISLQKAPSNKTRHYDRMTPNYDCLFTELYSNNAVGSMALNMFAEENEGRVSAAFAEYGFYTGRDFVELAIRLELGDRATNKFLYMTLDKRDELLELIQTSFMPEELRTAALESLEQRYKALRIGIHGQ